MASLQHSDPPRQRVWRTVYIPLIVFGLAVLGTRLWIESHIRPPENRVFLTARHEIPGYRFVPVAMGSKVEDTLATTNLFNGHFLDGQSQRVSVFAAHWQPEQGDMNSLRHTPDGCWVGTGFRSVRYGQPSEVFFFLGGCRIPFQCRVLQHPKLSTPEITLWAACVDGRWDEVPYEPQLDHTDAIVTARDRLWEVWVLYKNRWAFFCERIHLKSNLAVRKQFVRFSIPLTTEWQPALAELEAFAHLWLEPQ
jgi:hypothetical protein